MQILGLIAVGLVIGALARLLKPGRQRMSILATLLLGVAGAVIGGLIADWLDVGSVTELNFWGFLFALIVAVLLIGVAEAVSAGRNRAVR
ncbi:MAG TPA: GlsB/YeaQ/YmgE family stress response membrane protein [Geodermatophilus sp.]|nr:GlsB/YeaQ/YmgE family stress response membrane protein [Geodermatophilus sp.]